MINFLKKNSFPKTFLKIVGFLSYKFKKKFSFPDPIHKRRIFLSNKFDKEFNSTIRYGPFKGFKFYKSSWWGWADRVNMLFGLYEQEVSTMLKNLPKKYKYFIDLGAADGYYGVGVLVAGLFKKSYCYEISNQGQKIIKENALLNNVNDKVTIKGMATKNFEKDFSKNVADKSVLFVDIEGGEYKLFSEKVLQKFQNSIIFIELHRNSDRQIENNQVSILRNKVKKYFRITVLTTTNRDLSTFKELNEMSDNDRWIICSEGRGEMMTWWRLDRI